MPRSNRKNRIPRGWFDYTDLGKPVVGTRFIACKVPLKEAYDREVPEESRFRPRNLVQQVAKLGFDLGLVIDLTATDRYYDPQDFIGLGVQYEKILTVGHTIPSRDVVANFFKIVSKFLSESDKLVCVHCTHGLNRTGHLVCRYMIDKMQYEPEDAIQAFNSARGHKIERENYLCELKGGTPQEIAAIEEKMTKEHLMRDTKHEKGLSEESTGNHPGKSFYRDMRFESAPYPPRGGPSSRDGSSSHGVGLPESFTARGSGPGSHFSRSGRDKPHSSVNADFDRPSKFRGDSNHGGSRSYRGGPDQENWRDKNPRWENSSRAKGSRWDENSPRGTSRGQDEFPREGRNRFYDALQLTGDTGKSASNGRFGQRDSAPRDNVDNYSPSDMDMDLDENDMDRRSPLNVRSSGRGFRRNSGPQTQGEQGNNMRARGPNTMEKPQQGPDFMSTMQGSKFMEMMKGPNFMDMMNGPNFMEMMQGAKSMGMMPGPSAMGMPGPNDMGMPGPNDMGMPGPNAMGMPVPNAMGMMPGPNAMGMPGPNAMGMPGPNAMGMPGPNAMGMPGPNAMGMPGPSAMGMPGPGPMGMMPGPGPMGMMPGPGPMGMMPGPDPMGNMSQDVKGSKRADKTDEGNETKVADYDRGFQAGFKLAMQMAKQMKYLKDTPTS